MGDTLLTIARYVPARVVNRLVVDPRPPTRPFEERFPAAVLFADITGFNTLAENLARCGPNGAEELAKVLNDYFGRLIDIISAHGGEVVKFAGDAVLTLWPASKANLAAATLQAVQAAQAAQEQLCDYRTRQNQRLTMRIAIGADDVFAAHVGGAYGHWELLVTGPGPAQATEAERQAQPGDVIVSKQAWKLIRQWCIGETRGTAVCLHMVSHRLLPLPTATPSMQRLPAAAATALRAYIPEAVLARLEAEQTEWLAELRPVTVMFITLPSLRNPSLGQAQIATHELQTILRRHRGTIHKLSLDEKGVTVIAAMGLPYQLQNGDSTYTASAAASAVQAARLVLTRLRELGMPSSGIGIATGRTFCGTIGNDRRCEYTLISETVNLAARLMQAAGTGILCDAATCYAAGAQVRFDPLPSITVKGKEAPIQVWRPLDDRVVASASQTHLIGRAVEIELLANELQALKTGPPVSRVVVIEGEAGIGKSKLVAEFIQQAVTSGIAPLIGGANGIDESTPYHAWCRVYSLLLDFDQVADTVEARRAQALARIGANPLAPLLNTLWHLDIPENELTQHMAGQVRADNTRDLLVALLRDAARHRPLLVVLEDVHWLDSLSWELVLTVAAEVRPLLLILTTRPMMAPLPKEYGRLLKLPQVSLMVLRPLAADETFRLICQKLGVVALPEPIGALILDKAEGHPFFAEELALALRDTGLITIAEGECRPSPGVEAIVSFALPDTIQGIITKRIDRLPPQQQLVLKVASILGRVFAVRTVANIHPIPADRPLVPQVLDRVRELDLIQPEMSESERSYLFKHVITQEVAYNLMLFAQRRKLHRAAAEWYERAQAQAPAPFYALLAYHFNRAIDDATEAPEVVAKAATYCGKAGQQALQSGAHREAADFLQQALHWDHALTDAWADRAGPFTPADDPPAHLRRASWERMLGDAYIGVGDMEAGRAHLETALRLLGRPLPQGKARLVLELVGQGLRQALHRLRPGRHLGRLAHSRAAVLETVRAYERLGEINFFLNDALRTLHCTVHGLNLAEIAGPSAELARISGSVAVTAGLMSLHGLARLYCHQAIEVAHQVDQLPAQAWAYMATALYNAGIGRWEEVQKTIEPALTLWSRLGARRYWEASAVVSAMTIAFHHGDFETSTRLFADIVESGRRGDNAQAHSWGLLGLAENALRLGKTEEAHDWLQAATILLPRHIGSTEELRLHALTALTYHRLERHADARHHLALAMNLVGTTSPTAYYALEAYSAVVEVALAQWQSKAISAAQLHKAIAGLKSFARIFPIARPRALLWRGQYCLLSKRPSGARRLWRKGLAVADRLSMPYEQRLLHESMSGAEVSHR